jgi:membrane-bound lytic murein transglycosylase B
VGAVRLGGDVWDTRDAVLGAANYLAANGGAQEAGLDRALRRYNNDVRYVRAVRQYADMLAEDPAALAGVHAWPVRYRTTLGDLVLPVGYSSPRSIPAREWLATQPR